MYRLRYPSRLIPRRIAFPVERRPTPCERRLLLDQQLHLCCSRPFAFLLRPTLHQQTRFFSRGGYSKLKAKQKKPDPLKTLGFVVKKDESIAFSLVKQTFLQIAMKHHPDTARATTDLDLEEHKRIFMEARTAFELLMEAPDGSAMLRQDSDQWQEDDFSAWFQEETGHDMPYMDAQTMKEVAEMTETVGGGLDRDGGMWTLARMVTDSVRNGGDGRDMLRLEAGEIRSREINGILRRKRNR